MKKPTTCFVILSLVALIMPCSANAAAYMKLGDIKGEAIEVKSVRWMAPESISKKQASRSADTAPGSLTITKELDKSSPKLAEMANTGGELAEMSIADGEKNYLLKKVKVVSVEKKGNQEVVTLRFQHREEFGQTQPQKGADHNSSRSNKTASSTKATDYNSSRSNRTTQ